MNSSSIFSQDALGLSIYMWLIIALALAVAALLVTVIYEHRRIGKLLRGTETESVEDTLLSVLKQLDMLTEFKDETERYLKLVEMRLRRSNQIIETQRFNPFKGNGTGGNQSFACAFLNENGDGLILSSLYSSSRMSVYAKPIKAFVPGFELTEEEHLALEDAKNTVMAK